MKSYTIPDSSQLEETPMVDYGLRIASLVLRRLLSSLSVVIFISTIKVSYSLDTRKYV